MITVTDTAAQKIKVLLDEQGNIDFGLRVGVMGGGCSGFQYKLAFEEAADEMDQVIESKGVQILSIPRVASISTASS